jgi:4-hydroxy-3-methylbut-2-en-1-yl diphosphate synthase IspG/GcpE
VGKVKIGSEHPIALQTMTTSDTRDVKKTVEEVMRCADAGADMVRITVQGMKEADACHDIREELFKLRCVCGVALQLSVCRRSVAGVQEALKCLHTHTHTHTHTRTVPSDGNLLYRRVRAS